MVIKNKLPTTVDTSDIKNKAQRSLIYQQARVQKAKDKRAKRKALAKEEKDDPEAKKQRLEKNTPNTQENTREFDETVVDDGDKEVEEDEAEDEFSKYYDGKPPKVIITTTNRATKSSYEFIKELTSIIPDSQFVKRGDKFNIKEIMEFCNNREYTDLVLLSEDHHEPTHLTIVHLPEGPTAHFRLTRIKEGKKIEGHGRATSHKPEVVLNNFNSRLGHTVGRMFAALFPQIPEFSGRQVVTFHNQRDFIFFRRHRYEFLNGKKVNLQEIGPRFTLRLRWMQKGLYDPKNGEYAWKFVPEMETSRRRFFL